jgi:C-terminal processing protease CtpA/Prc
MKTILIVPVFLLISMISVSAQNQAPVWPISGQKAGKDILYKPQDYIGTEKNYEDLFITAPEGTPVLSPVSGTIIDMAYKYFVSGSLLDIYKITVPSNKIDIVTYDKQQRKLLANNSKNIDAQFISISIGIFCGTNETYWISGLRPIQYFKTGHKINKGDVIGTAGFCYKPISQPCIKLARTLNSKAADPMSPFGLKSTFIAFKPAPLRDEMTVAEQLADFSVFRQALEEGHPGLYDYTSRANMDTTFELVRKEIIGPKSRAKFIWLLQTVLDSIRDSHTSLSNISGQPFHSKEFNIDLPVHFGFQHDSLLVSQTLPEYKNLLQKRIVKIDNDSAESLLKTIRVFTDAQEGYIDVHRDLRRLIFYVFYAYGSNRNEGDSVTLTFSDGTKAGLKYKTMTGRVNYSPSIIYKPMVNKSFEMKSVDAKTAYLHIYTFELTQTDEDSIRGFVNTISKSACRNLIIDLRDNPGGYESSCQQLFSLFADRPFTSSVGRKVKGNGKYNFLKNTNNYGDDSFVLFPDYKEIEGKDGYYMMNDQYTKPDSIVHFGGKLYLLANDYSYSASSEFASLVHKYKQGGVIIGRETGTCYYQMNAEKYANVYLKNSGLELRMPLVKLLFDNEMDKTIPWGHGVIPDYNIRWTFNEYFNIEDPILKFTLNLIREKENTK